MNQNHRELNLLCKEEDNQYRDEAKNESANYTFLRLLR
jgi:hypothetical protein